MKKITIYKNRIIELEEELYNSKNMYKTYPDYDSGTLKEYKEVKTIHPEFNCTDCGAQFKDNGDGSGTYKPGTQRQLGDTNKRIDNYYNYFNDKFTFTNIMIGILYITTLILALKVFKL